MTEKKKAPMPVEGKESSPKFIGQGLNLTPEQATQILMNPKGKKQGFLTPEAVAAYEGRIANSIG